MSFTERDRWGSSCRTRPAVLNRTVPVLPGRAGTKIAECGLWGGVILG
jgi:hypothetical protein